MAPSRTIIHISSDEDDHCWVRKKKQSSTKENDSDDDCVILDGDPDKSIRVVSDSGIEPDELLVVAEKGQVACRDYPHARHSCARFPFNTNPHEKYCDLCHCYVCDIRAPCVYWGTGKSSGDHCHSTDKEETWRELRQSSKQGNMTQSPPLHPAPSRSQPININEESRALLRLRLALDRLTVQADRLTGIVKWFDDLRGYGFITPDNGGEVLFVHKSSIKSEGFQTLVEGEAVEFKIDGRNKAIDVTGPGGSFVRGTTGHCSYTGSSSGDTEGDDDSSKTSEVTGQIDMLLVQPADRSTGVVKWFDSQKGYGFISLENGGEDLFVHQSSIKSKGFRSLAEGEAVEFVIERGEQGRNKAIDVTGPGGSFVQGTTRRDYHQVPYVY